MMSFATWRAAARPLLVVRLLAVSALALASLVGALSGCTSARAKPLSWDEASPVRETAALPPKQPHAEANTEDVETHGVTDADFDDAAAAFGSGERCERGARQLHALHGADAGWRLLMACARQGTLFQLRQVLNGPWPEEINRRDDGALLVGMIVASRGGDLEHDLALLHRQRIAVFSLADAVERPRTFDGRMLLVRARLRPDLSPGEEGTVLEEVEVVATVRQRRATRSTFRRVERRRPGERQAMSEWRQPVDVESEHVDEPTGHRVFARLPTDDPFLTLSRTQLFLVRFEGSRSVLAKGEVQSQPVGQIVAAFEARTRFLE